MARIQALQQRADQLAGKLDDQDGGKVRRERKLSGSGANVKLKARFFHEVSDAHVARIIAGPPEVPPLVNFPKN